MQHEETTLFEVKLVGTSLVEICNKPFCCLIFCNYNNLENVLCVYDFNLVLHIQIHLLVLVPFDLHADDCLQSGRTNWSRCCIRIDEGEMCDFRSEQVANLTRRVSLTLFETLIGGESAC